MNNVKSVSGKKNSQSIGHKLSIISVTITFFVLITATFIFVVDQIYTYKNTLLDNIVSIGSVVAANSWAPLSFQDVNAGEDLMLSLESVNDIKYAVIYDTTLEGFAEFGDLVEYESEKIESDLNSLDNSYYIQELNSTGSGWFATLTEQLKHKVMIVRFPILYEQDILGTLYISADISPLFEQLEWFLWLSIFVLLTAIALSYLLSNRLFSGISRPLFELAQYMHKVSDIEVYEKADIPHKDNEIRELIEGFNTLIVTIKSRDDRLHQQRKDLEMRSYELSVANKNLEFSNKEMEESKTLAEAASSAKSDFLATMSHEIRTPLNGVLGMAEILSDSKLNKDQAYYVSLIRSSGNGLLSLINDILDFSKIEAGKMELEEMSFDLAQLFEDTVLLFAEEAKNKNLELICSPPVGIKHYLLGDATRLRQVLVNLLGNAIKFTSDGEVSLNCEVTSQTQTKVELRISVKDTGIGISEEGKNKIFDAFTQADSTTTRTFGGTGLGLSISQRITALMGGSIGLSSTLGEGSSFYIDISFQLKGELKTSEDLYGLIKDKRVVVVDDSNTNLVAMQKQLEFWGVNYDLFSSPVQLLEHLKALPANSIPYDAGILDMNMQGMNGVELAEEIRKTGGSLSKAPLILLSSSGFSTRQGLFQRQITKPVRPSILLINLVRMLSSDSPIIDRQVEQTGMEKRLDLAGTAVMVVEDIVANQMVVTLMLERMGAVVHVMNNGQEAMDNYEKVLPSLILMDCQMPVMDGYTSTEKIREYETERNLPRVPVIALTANALQNDKDRCFLSGMDSYLSKPFRFATLEDVITDMLKIGQNPSANSIREGGAVELPDAIFTLPDRESYLDSKVTQALQEVCDDIEIYQSVVDAYIEEGNERLVALAVTIENRKAPAIAEAAHALKSGSMNIGALGLGKMLAKIEAEALKGKQDFKSEMKLIRREYETVVQCLTH